MQAIYHIHAMMSFKPCGFLHRRMPWHHMQIEGHNRTVHDLVEPYIRARLNSTEDEDASQKTTVLNLAVKYVARFNFLASQQTIDVIKETLRIYPLASSARVASMSEM
ncbi:hypothetical protein F4810DRAFT_650323 [Camillea tinctor]|nr:hypothetical protein F4810DRAFT_650323 [Camillea tinctor]